MIRPNAQTATALGQLALLTLTLTLAGSPIALAAPKVGTLEEVARLPVRPGNVTATPEGRVFATVHPFDKPSGVQLMEVIPPDGYSPWPDGSFQSTAETRAEARLDTPLGIAQDGKGRLWVVDMGLNLGKTRLWAFDIATGKLARKIDLPASVAPKGAFLQDLVVDADRGWVYLADIAPPGLVAIDINHGWARRFAASQTLAPETQAVMRVDGKPTLFGGKPASVGVDPLTLSKDGETLFFGAMNGTQWYALPTQRLREAAREEDIAAAIRGVGKKPVSDGAATDDAGNHFFTNLNANGIDRLDTRGRLRPLVRDKRLSWPDNVQFGPESWLYIAANQLHRTSAFTGGADKGRPPYRVMRVWTGTGGGSRR